MPDLSTLSKGVRPYIILIVLVMTLSLPGVFKMPVMDRDEARFAQATSQMLETDDYVVIRFMDELRNKKPVGIHWLQAASVGLISDVDTRDIWAYRIPSLLGAILTVLSLMWAGTALFNARSAFIGATLLGCTLLISSEAHIAKTDSALTGFITLAIAALAHMRKRYAERQSFIIDTVTTERKERSVADNLLGLLFWFAVGAGVLIKGPIAPMVIGLTIVSVCIWERRIGWLASLKFWPGPFVAILICVPWFTAVQLATDGAFLREAVGVDLGQKMSSGAEGHSGPIGYHLMALPIMFWPASLFLIPGLTMSVLRLVKARQRDDAFELSSWRFLLCWVIPSFIVFEVTPTKLAHYPMPLYPALALMGGFALDQMFKTDQTARNYGPARWLSALLFLIVGLLLAGVMSPWGLAALRADAAGDFGDAASRISLIWREDWNSAGAPIWPFIVSLIVTLGTVFATLRRQLGLALLGVVACSVATGTTLRGEVLPKQNWIIATNAAIDALNEVCGMPQGVDSHADCTEDRPVLVRAIAFAEPSFVFTLGGHLTVPPNSSTELPPKSKEPRPTWLIDLANAEGRLALSEIVEQAELQQRCVRIARRHVKNYSNNDASELAAVVVEPELCIEDVAPVLTEEITEAEAA